MPDSKTSTNLVARRSTRVFDVENDIDLAKVRDAAVDSALPCNGKPDDREKPSADARASLRASSMLEMVTLDDGTLGRLGRIEGDISKEAKDSSPSKDEDQKTPKIPGRPRNFGLVVPGIYRSGYPETEDYDFLSGLGLKTVVTLVDKEYPMAYQSFMQSNNIRHVIIKMDGTKKVDIPHAVMRQIIDVVLDRQNHPLLLHCNQGKHRTGCAVAVLRKVMGWPVESVVGEYTTYAHPKVREVDVKYIRRIEVADLIGINEPIFNRMPSLAKPKIASILTYRMRKLALATATAMLIWGVTYWKSTHLK